MKMTTPKIAKSVVLRMARDVGEMLTESQPNLLNMYD